jgi:hypothetical protein
VYSVAGAGGNTGQESILLNVVNHSQPDRKMLLDQISERESGANAFQREGGDRGPQLHEEQ